MIDFLFTSALFGRVVANNASVAGATGGCQAEVGSASAMAAAAAVAIFGGSPEASGHAMALAISNLLGLVCDPVAGLVEIPCVMRNAIGSGNALISADLALAGIESRTLLMKLLKQWIRLVVTFLHHYVKLDWVD